jgi:sugar phosphate isomerase/epimerase
MQLGIFAKTFAGTNPDLVLAQVKTAGFNVAHYNMACSGLASMPDTINPDISLEIKNASVKTDVAIAAVSGTYNMAHPDPQVRSEGHARLDVIASHCATIGTQLITLCTGTRDAEDQWQNHAENNSKDAWRDMLVSMESALAIAERHNIILGIEPELSNIVNSAIKARLLISEMQSPRLKIIFDAANLFEIATIDEQRYIISKSIEPVWEHIIMAHAKDRDAAGIFASAGQGVLDFDHYFKALHEIGFSGPMIAHGLKSDEAEDVCSFLKSKATETEINIT